MNHAQANLALHLLEFISKNNVSFRLVAIEKPNRSGVFRIQEETHHAHQGGDSDPGRDENQPSGGRMEEVTEFSVRTVYEDMLAAPPVPDVRRKISHGLDRDAENAPPRGTGRDSKGVFLKGEVRIERREEYELARQVRKPAA
ncbi:MAG TPA: hypothetical protein VNJ12_01170 [Candidatus Dormibacteraeota bacterium]|nr:hypothetical protein [Candidatus Dormibacteraeota bacterium]